MPLLRLSEMKLVDVLYKKLNLRNKWEGLVRKRHVQAIKRANKENPRFRLNARELSKLVCISCGPVGGADIDTIWAGAGPVKIGIYDTGFLKIGKDICINANCMILCRQNILIGDNVMLGPNVVIIDHDHDYLSVGWKNEYKTGKIEIGNNVWIGAGAVILRDTNIGDNAVIGAGTVVKGSVPANSVVYESRRLEIKEFIRQ